MKLKRFVKEKIWIIYFAVICLILIWQLFTCGTMTFESDILGVSADGEYEILDENMLETAFRVGRSNPEGFYIYSFLTNGLEFTDEKLTFTFWNEENGELIQRSELNMVDQVRNLYVPFEEDIPAGMNLRVRIQSKGFRTRGPIIKISDESSLGNGLWENGELLNSYLCGAICYSKVTHDYVKPVMYFLAEILIGIVLLLAEKKMSLPLYIYSEKRKTGKRRINWKKMLASMAVVCVLTVIFLDYVYTYTVEEMVDKRAYDVVCRESKSGEQYLTLEEGDEISQIFSVGENNFSGIGLRIENDKSTDAVLRICLYDLASGELLVEKGYELENLKKLSEYIPKEDIKDRDTEIIKQQIGIDLQDVLEDSAGKFYKLILKAENLSGKKLNLVIAEGDNFSIAKNGRTVNGNLCLTALYSNTLFLKSMFKWLAGVIILFLVLLTGCLCARRVPVEKIYAVSALVFGLIFCFLIPPYCVPDEWAHFDGAYRISNEMMGITEIPGPNRIYKRACDIDEENYGTLSITEDEYRALYENIGSVADDETLVVGYADDSIGNVTVFNYAASALGFTVARLMHWGHMPMLILGRIFNLFAVIAMMYFAIRKMPFAKSLIAVIGLLPITLQQMASCSYDGVIIGAAYIFTAYCLHIIFDEKISVMDIAVMSFFGCLVAACKGGVYAPMLGLVLIILFAGKKLQKKKVLTIIGVIGSMMLVFLTQFSSTIIALLSTAQGTAYRSGVSGGTELYTFSYFMDYPKEVVRIFQNTFVSMGDFYLQGLLGGALGIMDTELPWFLLMAFFVLLLLCVVKSKAEEKAFGFAGRVYSGFLCLASVVLILLSMLLAWTTIGTDAIQGVQGRYFIPIIGLGFLACRNNMVMERKRGDILVLAAGVLDMLAVGFELLSIF